MKSGNIINYRRLVFSFRTITILRILTICSVSVSAFISTSNLPLSIYNNDVHGCSRRQQMFAFEDDRNYDGSFDENDTDDDDVPPEVDVSSFSPPKVHSFGLKSRSSPNQRKALGKGAKDRASVFVCTNCSAEFVKWIGRCPTCGKWNTVQEFSVRRSAVEGSRSRPIFANSAGNGSRGAWLGSSAGVDSNQLLPISELVKSHKDRIDNRVFHERLKIPDNEEFNNVLGGGIMPGSLTLIGGEPGIGKSTLLLQVAGSVASMSCGRHGIGMGLDEDERDNSDQFGPVIYVSAEENEWQIASRAARLGIDFSSLLLLCMSDADSIAEIISNPTDDKAVPSLVIIDSIQTMLCESGGTSLAGGVTQVKETVGLFMRVAKSTSIPIFLVGHVTKSGDVAGPRTVEHMVDCVLYLEGDRTGSYGNLRVLRATKNRFGSSDEVGVYEMSQQGNSNFSEGSLVPVSDPSSLFLATRSDTLDQEGCAVCLALEGSRPITAEIQGLVTSCYGDQRGSRTVNGVSGSRLRLIIAVLQKRCGISFTRKDIFLNVVGGLKLDNYSSDSSSSDLSIAIAIVSSLLAIAVRSDTAFAAEVGLVGELRQVHSIEKRMLEAQRMGFSRIVTFKGKLKSSVRGIEIVQCNDLRSALNAGLVTNIPIRKKTKRAMKSNQIEKETPGKMKHRRGRNRIFEEFDESMEVIDDDEEDDDFPYI